jgi:hypothetical protein
LREIKAAEMRVFVSTGRRGRPDAWPWAGQDLACGA